MLGIDHFCICHSFPTRWSPYFFGCNHTNWYWHCFLLDGTTRYLSPVTPSCPFLGPTFWKLNGLILSPITSFLGRSPTQARVYLAYSKCSFKYHANMSLLMCGSKGKRLVISSSYHTCISFIFSSFFSNAYLSWLATSYNCPFFIMLVWVIPLMI
jgi:hypothetical protein